MSPSNEEVERAALRAWGVGEGGGEDGDSAKAAKEDANPIVSPQVGLGGGAPNNIIRGGMECNCGCGKGRFQKGLGVAGGGGGRRGGGRWEGPSFLEADDIEVEGMPVSHQVGDG